MPRARPFHDPAPRLSSNTPDERSLASTTDVRRDAARSDGHLDIRVVVALVEAQMLRTPWATGCAHDNCIERVSDKPLVVDVRARDLGREWYAPTIRKNVPLHPSFGAICRVRTCEIPPLGALTIALSSEPHLHWIPRRRSSYRSISANIAVNTPAAHQA